MQLVNNGSATTTATQWPGGQGVFRASATFGGGSVKLQCICPDGTNWMDVGTDTSLTANGGGRFWLPPISIRVAIATATAVYADADQVHS